MKDTINMNQIKTNSSLLEILCKNFKIEIDHMILVHE